MKVQFNKEFVLKHRFWLMLAFVLPVSLAVVVLLGGAARETGKIRDGIQADLKKAEDAAKGGTFWNDEALGLLGKKGDEIGSKKFDVWKKAFGEQKDLFTWPREIEELFHFTNGKFALEVSIERKTPFDYASLPEDAPALLHGQVLRRLKDYMEVRDRKNQLHTFYNTPQIKVDVTGEDDKTPKFFDSIRQGDFVKVKYQVGKSFGDPLTVSEQNLYAKVYKSQIAPILEQVVPVDEKGKGVVQFPSYVYSKYQPPPANNSFFYYVPGDWIINHDISEEAWLAQEDLWIQRELFRLVKLANDYVSNFRGQGGEVKDKEYIFTNPYWQMTLKWSGGNKLLVKLDNQLNRRQKLDMVKFRVRTNKGKAFEPEAFEVVGEPLAPRGVKNSSITQVVTLPPGANRTGIYAVEQILDWETAAVRRIDQVAFGGVAGPTTALCHRLAGKTLLPYKQDPAAAEGGAGGPGGPGGAGGPAGGPGGPAPGGAIDPKMMGGGIFGPGSMNVKQGTPNKLIKERYLEVQQGKFRRLPVGLALIVDQDHVDRVQAAFNNSVFRFMTTQVIINRYPGSLRPQVVPEQYAAGPGAEGDFRKPFGPPIGPMGIDPLEGKFKAPMPPIFEPKGKLPPFGEPKGKTPMGLEQPGGIPGVGSQGQMSVGEDLETNVELIIYGIITIYEQPRAASDPATTTAAEAPNKK